MWHVTAGTLSHTCQQQSWVVHIPQKRHVSKHLMLLLFFPKLRCWKQFRFRNTELSTHTEWENTDSRLPRPSLLLYSSSSAPEQKQYCQAAQYHAHHELGWDKACTGYNMYNMYNMAILLPVCPCSVFLHNTAHHHLQSSMISMVVYEIISSEIKKISLIPFNCITILQHQKSYPLKY